MLNIKALAVGLLAGALVTGSAFAIAAGGDGSEGSEAPAGPVEVGGGVEVFPANAAPVGETPSPVAPPVGPTNEKPLRAGSENIVSGVSDPPEIVADCQRLLATEPNDTICRIVRAKAAGNLPPGRYSDAQLETALDTAEAAR